jgi:hypothetical protein
MYDWDRMLIQLLIDKAFSKLSNSLILKFSLDLPCQMVVVAQLVRALDCGSRGRGFEPRHPPIFSFSRVVNEILFVHPRPFP